MMQRWEKWKSKCCQDGVRGLDDGGYDMILLMAEAMSSSVKS